GEMKLRFGPAETGRPRLPAQLAAHLGEAGRNRALEGEDRLLLVADREQRPRRLARSPAGEEFLDQGLHHLPLARAGVLRLVDENVVDAAVELVMHPGGGVRARQKVRRLDDQVLEVERAAQPLP